jgi:hypothetical protein
MVHSKMFKTTKNSFFYLFFFVFFFLWLYCFFFLPFGRIRIKNRKKFLKLVFWLKIRAELNLFKLLIKLGKSTVLRFIYFFCPKTGKGFILFFFLCSFWLCIINLFMSICVFIFLELSYFKRLCRSFAALAFLSSNH